MKRTAGITVNAVLSAAAGLLAAWPVLAFLWRGLPAAGDAPVPNLRGLLIAVALFQLGFAAWGLWNAAGLLRMRAWARVSVLCFAAVLVILNAGGLYAALAALRDLPPGASRLEAACLQLAPRAAAALVGIWWLVYFNTSRIKNLFLISRI
jgi:hypothetical protein